MTSHISQDQELGKVTVSTNKIVNGKAINMGMGDYTYGSEAISHRNRRNPAKQLRIPVAKLSLFEPDSESFTL